jgi:hypothetical protein
MVTLEEPRAARTRTAMVATADISPVWEQARDRASAQYQSVAWLAHLSRSSPAGGQTRAPAVNCHDTGRGRLVVIGQGDELARAV